MICLIFLWLQAPALSQELVPIYEWEYGDIVDASSDISGSIYVSNKKGVITKYSEKGDVLISYSGDNTIPISSIDVSRSSKIFGFYRDSQSYILFDRFLNPLNQARINSAFIGYATESAYSADDNLWVFDQTDLTVKKVNMLNHNLVTSISLALIVEDIEWDIQQIEDYQNRIYLLNSTGEIFILDNMGNFIRKMEIMSDSCLGFKGDYLFYAAGPGIFSYHLYNQEYQQLISLEDAGDVLKVISTNNFLYLIFRNKIIALK